MSTAYISNKIKTRLWALSAGRCEYRGCNEELWRDSLTMSVMNNAYVAHIIADSEDGPRGNYENSSQLRAEISNLMLLCPRHHKLIDVDAVAEHPIDLLMKMKWEHEERIQRTTSMQPNMQSHILFYGSKIGLQNVPLNIRESSLSIMPYYPASDRPIEIGMKNDVFVDSTPEYWMIQEKQLVQAFAQTVTPIRDNHAVQHFSVFALAPQPLLIKLGTLLGDIYAADVFQRHREPSTWTWQGSSTVSDFEFFEPINKSGTPVLVFSLSGTIVDERITEILGDDSSIWRISIPNPNNDFLKTRVLLSKFRTICRTALDKIKVTHGQNAVLHLFPAMPVSAAVELGRIWMPKADIPMIIYDQNSASGGFIQTITIKIQ